MFSCDGLIGVTEVAFLRIFLGKMDTENEGITHQDLRLGKTMSNTSGSKKLFPGRQRRVRTMWELTEVYFIQVVN